MLYMNPLEEVAATADETNDHFGQLFPLAIDPRNKTQPVWFMAPSSSSGYWHSRSNRPRTMSAVGIKSVPLVRFISGGNWESTSDGVDVRSWLSVAAATKNAKLSAQAMANIDLTNLEPEGIVMAVQLALAAGAHIQARQLNSN